MLFIKVTLKGLFISMKDILYLIRLFSVISIKFVAKSSVLNLIM